VISPKNKEQFLVDVKGQCKKNSWLVSKKRTRNNLFYILAYVPTGEANEFFILTQEQANGYVRDYKIPGFLWTQGREHKNSWDILPK
jgi:hypothetical protein